MKESLAFISENDFFMSLDDPTLNEQIEELAVYIAVYFALKV